MTLFEPPPPGPRAGWLRRSLSLALSVGLHASMLAWVALAPSRTGRTQSMYDQLIRPKQTKLVWYSLREKLPDVKPLQPSADKRPAKALVQLPQTIVSHDEIAKNARQMIFVPEQQEAPKEVPSPNLVAVSRPEPKAFSPPPSERPRPSVLPDAPLVTSTVRPPPLPANLTKPQPRAFAAPPVQPRLPPAATLPTAPQFSAAMNLKTNPVLANPALPVRPAPKTFVPPLNANAGRSHSVPALPSAPELQAALPTGAATLPAGLPGPSRPLPRAFVPPGVPSVSSAAGEQASLPAAPEVRGEAVPSVASAAIVGLNPSSTTEIPLPEGRRRADFSGGPQLRPEGGTGGTVDGALLSVPGLLVQDSSRLQDASRDNRPAMIARVDPTSQQNLLAAARMAPPKAVAAAPARPFAARVASSPDPRMEGRTIYTLAIQMPNITSFSGSWIMWFAEHEQAPGTTPELRPPLPLRKVDPKYIPSAMADRVEGTVRLAAVIRRTGKVDSVTMLQGLDERLDRSAEEALAKWEFDPATRNGSAVDVDAVVEIPFRLGPRNAK